MGHREREKKKERKREREREKKRGVEKEREIERERERERERKLCAHMEEIRHFDLLKAFVGIERVVKFDFFSKKVHFTSYVHNMS